MNPQQQPEPAREATELRGGIAGKIGVGVDAAVVAEEEHIDSYGDVRVGKRMGGKSGPL